MTFNKKKREKDWFGLLSLSLLSIKCQVCRDDLYQLCRYDLCELCRDDMSAMSL